MAAAFTAHGMTIINRPRVAGAVLPTPLSFINRPGVAEAVLQSPPSLINSLIH